MTSRHLNKEEISVLLNEDDEEPFGASEDELGMEEYSVEQQNRGFDPSIAKVNQNTKVAHHFTVI